VARARGSADKLFCVQVVAVEVRIAYHPRKALEKGLVMSDAHRALAAEARMA
jgi:hypothetical protein